MVQPCHSSTKVRQKGTEKNNKKQAPATTRKASSLLTTNKLAPPLANRTGNLRRLQEMSWPAYSWKVVASLGPFLSPPPLPRLYIIGTQRDTDDPHRVLLLWLLQDGHSFLKQSPLFCPHSQSAFMREKLRAGFSRRNEERIPCLCTQTLHYKAPTFTSILRQKNWQASWVIHLASGCELTGRFMPGCRVSADGIS